MQLERFKPAWQQIKLEEGMKPMSTASVLKLIETPQSAVNRTKSLLVNLGMFLILLIISQGG